MLVFTERYIEALESRFIDLYVITAVINSYSLSVLLLVFFLINITYFTVQSPLSHKMCLVSTSIPINKKCTLTKLTGK